MTWSCLFRRCCLSNNVFVVDSSLYRVIMKTLITHNSVLLVLLPFFLVLSSYSVDAKLCNETSLRLDVCLIDKGCNGTCPSWPLGTPTCGESITAFCKIAECCSACKPQLDSQFQSCAAGCEKPDCSSAYTVMSSVSWTTLAIAMVAGTLLW